MFGRFSVCEFEGCCTFKNAGGEKIRKTITSCCLSPLTSIVLLIYYQILEIPEDSDQTQIRAAYLHLVKRYHPDSGTAEANVEKFHKVDEAFRVLMEREAKRRWDVEIQKSKAEEQDIKHTAPQHRQYLSYEGIGMGNPFQRQKQYAKVRAMQAVENVMQHRISKTTADEKAVMAKVPFKHKIKTKYGFERLVEDLIQEGMSQGIFDNLPGSGKPLPQTTNKNPYVDFVTHKLNEILIDNGFCPEWITLQKEIRQELMILRSDLSQHRRYFGPHPLRDEENKEWLDIVQAQEKAVKDINKKITKYNLLVPMMEKQMLMVDLEKEAHKILINGEHSVLKRVTYVSDMNNEKSNNSQNLFGVLQMMFKKFS